MSQVQAACQASIQPPPGRSVRMASAIHELATVFEPDVNTAVLERTLTSEVAVDASHLVQKSGASIMGAFGFDRDSQAEIRRSVAPHAALANDVLIWVELLCTVTGCDEVGLRLQRIERAMCPRFHVDRVMVRVVCTYFGRGTEILPSEYADRRYLGHSSGEPSDGTGLIYPGVEPLRAGAGDVVLLKGELWEGNAGRGAIHRSPSASAAEPRLVLTLDPLH